MTAVKGLQDPCRRMELARFEETFLLSGALSRALELLYMKFNRKEHTLLPADGLKGKFRTS